MEHATAGASCSCSGRPRVLEGGFVKNGRLFAAVITLATLALIAIGTFWPNETALAFAGGETLLPPSNSPEAAVSNLAHQIGRQAWNRAYSSLGNKAEF